MPNVKPDESRADFVARCVPLVIEDGTAADEKQATAVCQSIYDASEAGRQSVLARIGDAVANLLGRNDDQPADEPAVLLDVSGAPGRAFAKDVIRVGKWHDPKTGRVVDVTSERLDHWADNFARMRAAGVNVPIYDGHNRTKPLGHVAALTRDGDTLRAVHAFADDAAEQQAKRARFSSVCIEPGYASGDGAHYNDVITHVAATAEPVVPGQGDYIALSRVADEPAASNTEPSTKDTPKMLDRIKNAVGLAAEANDDAVLARINELAARPEPPAELARDVAELVGKSYATELDRLVEKRQLSPAAAKALGKVFTGDAEDDKAVNLSRTEESRAVATAVIEALKLGADTPAEGEKTGAQLSLDKGDDADDGENILLAMVKKNNPED